MGFVGCLPAYQKTIGLGIIWYRNSIMGPWNSHRMNDGSVVVFLGVFQAPLSHIVASNDLMLIRSASRLDRESGNFLYDVASNDVMLIRSAHRLDRKTRNFFMRRLMDLEQGLEK